MPGFACVLRSQGNADPGCGPVKALSPLVEQKKSGQGYTVYQYVTGKFLADKVFEEDAEVLVAMEGVVLNFRDLQRSTEAKSFFETVKALYRKEGDAFCHRFRGEFCGLLYDKAAEKWLVYTNHTGFKPVFFCKGEGGLVCGTDLMVMGQILRRLGWRYSLDEEGAYFLLTYGFMLEDYTLLREVRKLRPGQYLKYEQGQVSLHQFHTLRSGAWVDDSPQESIERADELFRRAVVAEYDKDREYGYRHLAHLSGGLDSRMNVFVARELGYDGILNVTFSQSGHLDERLPRVMAAGLGNEFVFYALDNGNFLRHTLPEAVSANGGLALYAGAAHELSMYRAINWEPFGVVHSGQLGDAVLGTYMSVPRRQAPVPATGAYASRLLDRVAPSVKRILSRYDSEEVFKMANRGANGVANGNWMGNQYSEVVSPFLHLDFLEYAWAIPPEKRFREKFYVEWIRAKHPNAAAYAWARTGLRPGANQLLVFMLRLLHGLRHRLLGEWARYSMNPFNFWFKTNAPLRDYVDGYLRDNLMVLADHPELQADCSMVAREGELSEKTQVMTLLEAVKRLFPDVSS